MVVFIEQQIDTTYIFPYLFLNRSEVILQILLCVNLSRKLNKNLWVWLNKCVGQQPSFMDYGSNNNVKGTCALFIFFWSTVHMFIRYFYNITRENDKISDNLTILCVNETYLQQTNIFHINFLSTTKIMFIFWVINWIDTLALYYLFCCHFGHSHIHFILLKFLKGVCRFLTKKKKTKNFGVIRKSKYIMWK